MNTVKFQGLICGEQFVYNNKLFVKLSDTYNIAVVLVNACSLDKGELVLFDDASEVVYVCRSY